MSIDESLLVSLRNPNPATCEFFGDAIARHRVDVCWVENRFSSFTPLRNVTLGGLVSNFLVEHEVRQEKQENGLIYSDLHGRRKDDFAQTVCAAVYDIDHRHKFGAVVEQREREGYVGATHTTFNHGKRLTLEEADKCIDWLRDNAGSSITPFTDELARQFLPELRDVRALDGGKWTRVDGKTVYRFEHAPEDRLRAIYFLDENIPLAEVGQDGCRAIYHHIGRERYGDDYDRKCENPARIQWTPSCRPDAPHELEVHRGNLIPWRPAWEFIKADVEKRRLEDAARAAQRLKDPPKDVAEISHYLQFISPDSPRAEWLSVVLGVHNETKGSEDGRALVHSWSAGAPRLYNPEDLDANIWDWATANERDGSRYTMASIVHHAMKHPQFKRYRPRLKTVRSIHPDEYQAMLDSELLK
jgi:hypothetical protein